MNYQPSLFKICVGVLLTSLLILAGCSTQQDKDRTQTETKTKTVKKTTKSSATKKTIAKKNTGNLWDEIVKGYGFPPVSDEKVRNNLRWLANNQRYLDRVTEQSRPYLYYVADQLKQHDLPLEFALLPVVESAYNPFAQSPSRAVGVWQFMPQTGRNFGLAQNHWYDGRRDIVASTDAAIRYFKRLHGMFDGDWFLVIAAYNAGEGTVSRAIAKNRKQGKGTDFWSLPLSQQTRSYVPQLIALSKVIADPAKYDLELAAIPNNPYFTAVNVNGPIDLAQAARMAAIDPKELRNLNAGYSRWITNPSGPHQLLVPVADATEFKLTLDKLPKIQPTQVAGDYKVKSGDTLGALAKRFGTSVAAIQAANDLKSTNLRVGQSLSIPGQAPSTSTYALQAEQEIAQRTTKNAKAYYTVKSGDNFWTIAKNNGTSVNNLLKWNDLSAKSKLKPGQKLLVAQRSGAESDNKITYQIKSGDTLNKIANKFDVSTKDILSWNKVKNESYIHPGQELTIYLSAKN